MQIVFDMGGTRSRFALVDDGKLGEIIRIDTDPGPTGFAKFLGALEELAADHKIDAISGGLPGQLQGEEGELVWAPNLKGWLGLQIKARLEEHFRCSVRIENDVVLGGMGEAHGGAGVNAGVMAYFTVSTGVNGVRIVDGLPDDTIDLFEVGQQLLVDENGAFATLESRLGGAAMELKHGKHPGDIKDAKVWHEAERVLAAALYNTMLYWSPAVVVFGGSMMRDINLKRVAHALEQLPSVGIELPRLEYAKLQDTQGLRGAVALLKQPQS